MEIKRQQICVCGRHMCTTQVPLFQSLSTPQLTKLQSALSHRDVMAHEPIVLQGDIGHSLILVQTGMVKLIRTNSDGDEVVVSILYPGDFFGELSLFTETPHGVSAYAQVPTKLCILDKDKVEELIKDNPDIAFAFLRELSERLQDAQEHWEVSVTRSVEERLARFILEQAKLSDDNLVVLKLSRQDIAGIIGTTPETVSRKIQELAKKNIIKLLSPRRILIKDKEQLELLNGDED